MSNPLNGQISPAGGGISGTLPASSFPLLAPAGSAAAPSYSFTASPDTGLFHVNGALAFTEDGTELVAIDNAGIPGDGLRIRGGAQLTWSPAGGAPASSTPDLGLHRVNAGILRITDGSTVTGLGWVQGDAGKKRLTANHTVVTNSATLANINDLTVSVGAGQTYMFQVFLYATTVNTSGIKVAMAGTATHTNIIYDVIIHGISTPSFLTSGRATAAGTAVGVTASGTAAVVEIRGTTTINAAGTFLVQAAQNAETGAAESVIILRGSTFSVTDVL